MADRHGEWANRRVIFHRFTRVWVWLAWKKWVLRAWCWCLHLGAAAPLPGGMEASSHARWHQWWRQGDWWGCESMWGDGRVSTSGRTNECLGIWCVMWCPCLTSEAWKLEHYTLGVPWVVLQCLITKKSAIIKLANQLLENVRDLNFPTTLNQEVEPIIQFHEVS